MLKHSSIHSLCQCQCQCNICIQVSLITSLLRPVTDAHARHTEDFSSQIPMLASQKTLPHRYPCSSHRRLSLTDAHARHTEDSPSQKTLPNRYPCSPHRRFSLTDTHARLTEDSP